MSAFICQIGKKILYIFAGESFLKMEGSFNLKKYKSEKGENELPFLSSSY